MEKKMNDICEIKNRLISYAQAGLETEGDVHVMGEVIDMIKDCYEMEEKCWKACYYKTIVEAMKDAEGPSERYGYDNYRYRSGRFAPKGHGHFAGYIPMDMMPGHDAMYQKPYGFPMDEDGNNGRSGYPMPRMNMQNPYSKYLESRRHYHESKDPEARKEMEHHAKEHVEEVEDTVRDIWDDATPELRKEMKRNLTNLVNSLPA